MADFIRFQAGGRPVLVNADQITDVWQYIKGYDHTTSPYTPIFDEGRTKVNVVGGEDDFIIVDEPFEQVCDKLNGNVHTGTWIEKKVEDDEHDPYRLFKRRFYCSECGEWQTYGMTSYCPFCGKPMRNGDEAE